jgi:hypothetical protein
MLKMYGVLLGQEASTQLPHLHNTAKNSSSRQSMSKERYACLHVEQLTIKGRVA